MDTDSNSSGGVTAAMEGLSTADLTATSSALPAAEDETVTGSGAEAAGASGESSAVTPQQPVTAGKKSGPVPNNQMKQIRPLLNVSSRFVWHTYIINIQVFNF